jgi:predicted transcriptional regulator
MVGNISNFTRIDVLRCFLALNDHLSRQELCRKLDLGEGTVRTILNILKDKKLISSTRKGHSLTDKGNKVKKQIMMSITLPKKLPISLYKDFQKIGVIVRDVYPNTVTIEKRDTAVKNGAEGCLIFSDDFDLLIFSLKQNFEELRKFLQPEKGDIVVVTFAHSRKWAEISALAVAIELNKELKEIFSSFC